MKLFLGQGVFAVVIVSLICLSLMALFIAILVDFALFHASSGVEKEKRTFVETTTMTGFFLVFWAILACGVGAVPVSSPTLSRLLAVLGTAMIVSGSVVNILGRFRLGGNWANQVRIYDRQTLVRTGPYALVRHPLYASIILMFLGGCLVYRNLLAAAALALVFIPTMAWRAKQEEILLAERFAEYADYRAVTGMFFPRLTRKRKKR